MDGIRHIGESTTGKWIDRWSVNSMTEATKKYVVAVDAAGNYGCSCPAWKFQRKKMLAKNPNWKCKHTEAVLVFLGMDYREPEIKVVVGDFSVMRMIDLSDLD